MKRLPPFQRLLDEHRNEVYRYVRAMVGPEEADDVFQETFLAAFRAYPRLAHADNLRGWVLRIATRKSFDAGRGRGRRPLPVAEVPDAPARASPDGDPELWRAVRSLPPKQRAAVVHRYVHDLSYADIGDLIGSSAESARANVHHGIARLREQWGSR